MAEQATIEIQFDPATLRRLEAIYARKGTTFEEAVQNLAAMSLHSETAFVLPKKNGEKHSAFGCLKPYLKSPLPVDEEGAFAEAMVEKHREAD